MIKFKKTYKEYEEILKSIDTKLLATDKRFDNCVHLVLDDGSVFFYDSAFLMDFDEVIFLFTEHHLRRFFYKEELLKYAQYKRVWKIEEFKKEE